MLGLLPPSSRVTRFTRSAQRAMMCLPVRVEPVNTIFATPGCSTRALPADRALAGQHLEQALGKPGGQGEFGQPEGGQRGRLGGLEEDGVARRQRRGEPPGRDGHREVPRGDDPDDAERLQDREVDAARHRDLPAQQPFGAPRGVVEEVADVARLPAGVADGVAGLPHLQLGQLLDVFVDDSGEAAQQAGPVGGRRGGPGALGGGRPADGGVDVGGGGGRDGGDDLGGGRGDDVQGGL
ncbi:hypothetical protein SCALM49S_08171 [Streptomyces californicus]